MPTYQYACTEPSCRHEFELVQSFTDPAADECPVCGHSVRKKFSAVGVVFKGSGFYRTDSRSESKSASNSSKASSSESSSSSSSKDSSKTPAGATSSSSSSSSSTGSSSSGSGGGTRAAATA